MRAFGEFRGVGRERTSSGRPWLSRRIEAIRRAFVQQGESMGSEQAHLARIGASSGCGRLLLKQKGVGACRRCELRPRPSESIFAGSGTFRR